MYLVLELYENPENDECNAADKYLEILCLLFYHNLILSESKRKNDNDFERDKLDYENRIKDLNDKLAADNTSSLPIRTQRPQACGAGKTNDLKRDGSGVGETGFAELAEYNRGLVIQTGAKINAMAKELLVCADKVREAYDLK